MIDGCLDWQTNGLIRPDTVVAETNKYFFDQDTFSHWRGEACDCEPKNRNKFAASSELYQSWRRFATAAGVEAGSQTDFTDRMIREGFEYKRTSKARLFLGIQLRPPDEPFLERNE
jgi:putative DNA primase/helicase